MLPPLPPWLAPRYALKGTRLALVGLALLLGIVGCTTQTVRLEGFQVRLPLIGNIGPTGWKPYARQLEGEIKTVRIDLELTEAKHVATKRAYIEAQEEAARVQAEAIERTVARQERITEDVRQDYSRRISTLRSRADRLQRQARTDFAGSSSPVRLPADSNTAARIDGSPDCQRLPAADISTDLRCREIATEQAFQLDALIEWVGRQFEGVD